MSYLIERYLGQLARYVVKVVPNARGKESMRYGNKHKMMPARGLSNKGPIGAPGGSQFLRS
jgi:hypothetical protein